MLSLLLLRHAKSSWDNPELDDFERPLAKRGIADAPRMGRYLETHGLLPDGVLCSGAVRTRATLALILPELTAPAPLIAFSDALYLAPAELILSEISTEAPAGQRLLVIGHNPGLHALALSLTGRGDKKLIRLLAAGYPTSALVVLTFEAENWAALAAGQGRLTHFVTPRDLRE